MTNELHKSRIPLMPVAALLACLALCLAGCMPMHGAQTVEEWEATHPLSDGEPYYDIGAFTQTNGRYVYDDGNVVATKTGVDVSDHQEEIDWNAVAADGISFAMMRVGYRGNTEGGLYADERYIANLLEAHEAGIECGVYFYSQAVTVEEAEEEAAFVLKLLDGRQLEYPVAFDYEILPNTRIANVDAQTVSRMAEVFCSTIRAGGYQSMVYGNTYDLALLDDQSMAGCSLWCAEYDDGPSYARKADIWQYTSFGAVLGIDGPADLNLDLSDVPAA